MTMYGYNLFEWIQTYQHLQSVTPYWEVLTTYAKTALTLCIVTLTAVDLFNVLLENTGVYSALESLGELLHYLEYAGAQLSPYLLSINLVSSEFSDFPTNLAFTYGLKFTVSIMFLIFIRAGSPRYRYDFLTKLGWAKFLLFTLYVFAATYFIFILF